MENNKAFTLTNRGKASFFNCHCHFLPPNHMYRKNRKDFLLTELKRILHPRVFLVMNCMMLYQSTVTFTTRKLEKTNGITDGNIPSVIITDGHNSISKSVSIYRRPQFVGDTVGIYRRNISVGIYRLCRRWGIQFV